MAHKILFEVCCGSVDDAIIAEQSGGDRVELCSALFFGGLTPSIGSVIEAKGRIKIPVMVMIRPRGGGFCYTESEMGAMENDARLALQHGADGLVFGILKEDGSVDMERCAKLAALCAEKNKQAVFHRAIDVTPDPFVALDQLIEMGVTRVLTSGQEDSAPEGAEMIRRMKEHGKGKIEVLPGGGIKAWNLQYVLQQTGCDQIHLGMFSNRQDRSTLGRPQVTYGGALWPPEDQYPLADGKTLSDLAGQLKR